jgi:primosomal protein N' (replication factor Y)
MTNHQQELFETLPPPWELDDAGDTPLASIVFPEAPEGEFSYRIPDALRGQLRVGMRVRVPLGRGNRTVVGYCVGLTTGGAGGGQWKDIQEVIDALPLVSAGILELTRWMSDYYLCPWGPILEAVVPSGVRGQAGTREVLMLHVPTSVAARMTQLKLPPKQAVVLRTLVESPTPLTLAQVMERAACTLAPIQALRNKGLVRGETQRTEVGAMELSEIEATQPLQLSGDQQVAYDRIYQLLHTQQHSTVLLRGVTGSGKTEIYIRAIEEVTRFGRQAIVLVPEISLTPQTQRRFESRLASVAVLHSHLSPAQRHWQWQRIVRGEVQVVVGARSAVFAPTPHLGLIVMDEEHEPSFKQDTAPRYHAREVAIQRAMAEKVPLILGSATPSLESWHRARTGQYELIELPRRVGNRPMPDVATIDLRLSRKDRGFVGSLSRRLCLAMEQALDDGGQVILLLNRRGFATQIQCPACGEVVKCHDCEIALTHHRDEKKAICHYCNYQTDTPPRCPKCQFDSIQLSGTGTQRLENEIRQRFPNAVTLRMDSDTMRQPGSHDRALERFRRGEVQILVGTQLIAKGLDFPNVTLVGVVNADVALHFPDFRASERTFQLVTQVAGRTGRGDRAGRVLVQTFSPEHQAISTATTHDFVSFADWELKNREEFGYPPFSQVVRLVFRGESEAKVQTFAEHFVECLRKNLEAPEEKTRVLGPVPAPLAKLRGLFRYHALLQTEAPDLVRAALKKTGTEIPKSPDVQWIVDVDAASML